MESRHAIASRGVLEDETAKPKHKRQGTGNSKPIPLLGRQKQQGLKNSSRVAVGCIPRVGVAPDPPVFL